MSKTEKQVETKPAASEQSDAPVTRRELQELLDAQRREHERVVAALVDRLSASPGMSQEAIAALNEKMLQSVNIHEFMRAQNEKSQRWLAGDHARAPQLRCKKWLTGRDGYLLCLRDGPHEFNAGRGGRFSEYSAGVVFADGASEVETRAIAFDGWWRGLGINQPPQHFLQVALPAEQAEVMRAELAEIVGTITLDPHPFHARCRVYLYRYLKEQVRQIEALRADDNVVPESLPNPHDALDPAMRPGLGRPFETFERADPDVVLVDGSRDISDLLPTL